jgi:uncharacterized membrane protein
MIQNKMNNKPLVAAGTLLGIGLGGLFDGILFHQIMQIHSMLSAKLLQDELVNVKVSMFWDGIFSALTWVATILGVALLWRAGKRKDGSWSGQILWGAAFLGWGIFNTVEGIIDHFIFGIHHVVERLGTSMYDYLFLMSGIVFMIVSFLLISSAKEEQSKNKS